jgi:hypothetical protein
MWVEEAIAKGAAQARAWHQAISGEDVAAHGLLLTRPFAAQAAELPVESVEGLALRRELVLVPFDVFRS